MTFLDNPILIRTIDGKPLNNGFISQVILATLCIQDHSECKYFGIINMNCDVILGIDWLQKHNPSIDWELNQVLFSCCGMNLVDLNSGDAQFFNPSLDLVPVQDILISIISVDNFFSQNQIQAFGLINFISDSIVVVASVGDTIPVNSVLASGTIEYIKSKVLEKYHGFINIFVNKEATILPPHQDQDIKIKLEEGKTPPFGLIYSLMPTEKIALQSYISENLAKGFIRPSISSAASPILFVKKSNGSLHLCIDYQGLNAITKWNQYPLPLVNELLDAIRGCNVFTKLNLKSAFNLLM